MASSINTKCNCCDICLEETLLHQFFYYSNAQDIWEYAQLILHLMSGTSPILGPYNKFDPIQCIFGSTIPRHFYKIRTIYIVYLTRFCFIDDLDFFKQYRVFSRPMVIEPHSRNHVERLIGFETYYGTQN